MGMLAGLRALHSHARDRAGHAATALRHYVRTVRAAHHAVRDVDAEMDQWAQGNWGPWIEDADFHRLNDKAAEALDRRNRALLGRSPQDDGPRGEHDTSATGQRAAVDRPGSASDHDNRAATPIRDQMYEAITSALDAATELRWSEADQVYLDSCPTYLRTDPDCLECQTEAARFYEFEAARARTDEMRDSYLDSRDRALTRITNINAGGVGTADHSQEHPQSQQVGEHAQALPVVADTTPATTSDNQLASGDTAGPATDAGTREEPWCQQAPATEARLDQNASDGSASMSDTTDSDTTGADTTGADTRGESDHVGPSQCGQAVAGARDAVDRLRHQPTDRDGTDAGHDRRDNQQARTSRPPLADNSTEQGRGWEPPPAGHGSW